MQNLPQRLRESAFRRLEGVIANIVNNHPSETILDPKALGLTALTLADRLRGACFSLAKFDWPSTIINKEQFKLIYGDMAICHRITSEGTAIICATFRQTFSSAGERPKNYEIATTDKYLHVSSYEDMCKICSKVAAGEPPVTVTGLTPEDVKNLEESYDVRIDYNDNGTFTIL